jgi:hypothetical protein
MSSGLFHVKQYLATVCRTCRKKPWDWADVPETSDLGHP